jgi:hypothetical protein
MKIVQILIKNVLPVNIEVLVHLNNIDTLVYMVYRQCDLYERDASPCDINHQKDYTAWTSYEYDKNNFLLLFIDILFLDRV